MTPSRRGTGPLRVLALAGVLGLATVACPAFFAIEQRNPPDADRDDPGALPPTAEGCIDLARRLGVEGSSQAELRLALRALERAETLQGESIELAIESARVLSLIAEPLGKSVQAVRWLDRGDVVAAHIVAAAPDRVEGHYYTAAFVGLRAQVQAVGGLDLLPTFVSSARRAVEIDETYNDAAPLVALGTVLVKAPSWPHGVGDPDEGLELLERAVEISDYPVNRYLLGAALIDLGQKSAGCRELNRVLAAPKRGRWAKTGPRYRETVMLLMRSARCPRQALSD